MKKRIEHIDAFRGLCIFAVVYLHIILFCGLNTYQSSPIQVILKDFFLVGFYFISGFLSYKNDDTISNLINLRDFIVKKIKTLLIPSITIMALYCIIVMGSIKILWTPWNLWITWFTYVLFSINLIYAIISFICGKYNNKTFLTVILILTAIFSYILSSKKSSFGIIGNSIQLNNIFYYYPYFILGVLCRKYISLFYKFIHNKLFILSIASCYFTSHIINSIPLFIKCISIIFLLYYILEKIFIDNKDCVPNCNKIILSIFTNLGKYSLEIYFIHFFLLFKLPENVSNFLFFLQNDNCWWGHSSLAFAEFIILFPLIIIIAYSCIWISYFIKQIPFCGKIFFGKE